MSFVRDGKAANVKARNCVLALLPLDDPLSVAPQLPAAQLEALAYQVRRPLLLTNVLIRSTQAADKLGISGAYCPGRLHGATWLVKGIEVGDYRHAWERSRKRR